MAKKKRKKGRRPSRPQARPAQAPRTRDEVAAEPGEERERPEARSTRRREAPPPVSNRQARKEQARRERERRIKRARRARRIRRAVRWGLILGLVGGAAGAIFYVNTRPLFLEDPASARAAAALGCGEEGDGSIEESGAAGAAQHLAANEPPPEYASTPATAGRHAATTYQGPAVLQEPVNPVLETNLVHNLEHAYVIMYYRADGDGALPEETVERLTEIAERENKVLLAEYPSMPEGTSLAFTAWNKLLPCPEIGGDQTDQVVTVAEGFIEQYRGTSNAPEPSAG